MRPDPRYIDCPASYPKGRVILVSGGVDSLINADSNNGILLFVDFGHADARNEWEACKTLFGHRDLHIAAIRLETKVETANGVFVPARNLLLACCAVHYGSDIIIGAMKDDHSIDKTSRALASMTHLLTQQSGRSVTIRAPLLDLCKHEAVARYAGTPERMERMKQTWSCYGPGPERCMDCKACFKWSVALRWAHIDTPDPSPRITSWFLERINLLSPEEQAAIRAAQ